MQDGEERGPELSANYGEEGQVRRAVGHEHQVVEGDEEFHPKR